MKKYLLLILGGTMLVNWAVAQPVPADANGEPLMTAAQWAKYRSTNSLPRFDLDFSGGTPKQLVQAIEKATGKPLNAIIPDDVADTMLPALSVKNVTAQQVFDALLAVVSQKTVAVGNGYSHTRFGFATKGEPNANSVWYFYYDKPVLPADICLFFQLGPYLDAGYNVDDITTAAETAWKMLGETNRPKISYHKETRLLIVVGQPDQLAVIDQTLSHLQKGKPANLPNSEKPKDK